MNLLWFATVTASDGDIYAYLKEWERDIYIQDNLTSLNQMWDISKYEFNNSLTS
jgi:hypothetical protein